MLKLKVALVARLRFIVIRQRPALSKRWRTTSALDCTHKAQGTTGKSIPEKINYDIQSSSYIVLKPPTAAEGAHKRRRAGRWKQLL